jgi:hypothetical protein
MIGEFLYQLTARDGAQPLLEPHIEIWQASSAAISVSADHQVEEGYAWLIKNIMIQAVPDGVQSVLALACVLVAPGGNLLVELFKVRSNGAAGNSNLGNTPSLGALPGQVQEADRQFSDLLVPPYWSLRVIAQFSAGANPNSIRAALCAVRLPRGNIAV